MPEPAQAATRRPRSLRDIRDGSFERDGRFRVTATSGDVVAWMNMSADESAVHITGGWSITYARQGWSFDVCDRSTRRRVASFEPARIAVGGRLRVFASGRELRLGRRRGVWRLRDPEGVMLACIWHYHPGYGLDFDVTDAFARTAEFTFALPLALWIAYEWDRVNYHTYAPH